MTWWSVGCKSWLLIALIQIGPFQTLIADNSASSPVYRLLLLDSQQGYPYDDIRQALLAKLDSYGYQSGKNLQLTMETAANDARRGEQLLRERVKEGYDVIFVGGTVATIAAKQALYGQKQAVIFAAPTDPIGIGVIDAFDRAPNANFTGICYPVPVKARLRFIKRLLPHAKTLGLIYANMPQSQSYNRWLQTLLSEDPEFADLKILFRPVPFITGENGDQAMANLAIPLIQELDSQVDAFIKPNDQLGTRRPFSEVVYRHASKPLIGIVKDDVMGHWGATAVVYPSHTSIGEQAARMIKALLEGQPINALPAEWPQKYGFALDLAKTKHFGMTVPVELIILAGDNIVLPAPNR